MKRNQTQCRRKDGRDHIQTSSGTQSSCQYKTKTKHNRNRYRDSSANDVCSTTCNYSAGKKSKCLNKKSKPPTSEQDETKDELDILYKNISC